MKKVTSIQLIGVKIEVTDSNNQKNIGIHGKVIDETKNSLIIKDPSGEKKRLIKKNITITIKKINKKIKGNTIIGREEERIKSR